MSTLFGWDLLLKSVDKDVKSNQDLLMCFTHLVLINNGFKCVGIGDSKNLDGTETKTESLPNGWQDNYALRYIYQGRLYTVKGTSLEDGLMINMIRVDERKATVVQLNTRVVITKKGSLDDMIPQSKELADMIKSQLIDEAVKSKKQKDESCQTADLPLQDRDPMMLNRPSLMATRPLQIIDPVTGVGRNDLDPFAGIMPYPRGGVIPPPGGLMQPGGMLFVPPQGPRYNPGSMGIPGSSLPPGARFDPFRPPDVDMPRRPRRNPDNNEFQPPGFDDMYM